MANAVEIVIKALDATKGGISSAVANLKKLELGAIATAQATGLISLAAAGAAFAAAKSFAQTADEIGKLSQKTGISTETLSGLKIAAEDSGVGFEELQKALRGASQEAAKTNQTLEDLLVGNADRFAAFGEGAGKATEAQRIFGKAGADLIPLLDKGSDGLKRAIAEGKEFTTVIDKQTAATSDEFLSNLSKIGLAIKKGFTDQIKELLPYLLNLSQSMLELTKVFFGANGPIAALGSLLVQVGKSTALVAQIFVNAKDTLTGFADVWFSLWDNSIEGASVAWDELVAKMAGDSEKLSDIWNGKLEVPTPRNTAQLPQMENSDDVKKYNEAWQKMFSDSAVGQGALFAKEQEIHDKRVENIKDLQVSEEAKQAFVDQSAAFHTAKVLEIERQGLDTKAELELQYNEGSLKGTMELLNSEQGMKLAALENDKQIIDLYTAHWKLANESVKLSLAKLGDSVIQGSLGGMKSSIEGLIKGTMSLSQAMKNLGQSILDSVVSAFAEMIAKLLIMKTLGFVFGAIFGGPVGAVAGGALSSAGGALIPGVNGGFPGFGPSGPPVPDVPANIVPTNFGAQQSLHLSIDGYEFGRIVGILGGDGRIVLPSKVVA